MLNVFNLHNIYKEYFGKSPYYVRPKGSGANSQEILLSPIPTNDIPRGTIHYSNKQIAYNKIGAYGQDIWHPIELFKNDQKIIEIEACTIAIQLSKTIIKTAVSERIGTVKELFNVDDYKFTIRGFVIGKNRRFPEDDILKLKELHDTADPVALHGGYPELFLDESCQVAISNLEFPEVQGKQHWIRPFILTCESDFIRELEMT